MAPYSEWFGRKTFYPAGKKHFARDNKAGVNPK
jgi:hypothetical protein